jgi:hypothetical protein
MIARYPAERKMEQSSQGDLEENGWSRTHARGCLQHDQRNTARPAQSNAGATHHEMVDDCGFGLQGTKIPSFHSSSKWQKGLEI